MTDYKPKEWQDLEELYRQQNVRINELEEENKKLKEENEKLKSKIRLLEVQLQSLANDGGVNV